MSNAVTYSPPLEDNSEFAVVVQPGLFAPIVAEEPEDMADVDDGNSDVEDGRADCAARELKRGHSEYLNTDEALETNKAGSPAKYFSVDLDACIHTYLALCGASPPTEATARYMLSSSQQTAFKTLQLKKALTENKERKVFCESLGCVRVVLEKKKPAKLPAIKYKLTVSGDCFYATLLEALTQYIKSTEMGRTARTAAEIIDACNQVITQIQQRLSKRAELIASLDESSAANEEHLVTAVSSSTRSKPRPVSPRPPLPLPVQVITPLVIKTPTSSKNEIPHEEFNAEFGGEIMVASLMFSIEAIRKSNQAALHAIQGIVESNLKIGDALSKVAASGPRRLRARANSSIF